MQTGSWPPWAAPTVVGGLTIQQSTPNQPALVIQTDTGDGSGLVQRVQVENNPGQALVDIDFRSCVVNIGDPNGASKDGTQLGIFANSTDVGTNRFNYYPPGEATNPVARLGPNGPLTLAMGGKSTHAVSVTPFGGGSATCFIDSNGNFIFNNNGTAPPARPVVSGSRSANAALASALTALASEGVITDSSTA